MPYYSKGKVRDNLIFTSFIPYEPYLQIIHPYLNCKFRRSSILIFTKFI